MEGTVIIIGMAASGMYAPYDGERWGLNHAYCFGTPLDRLYILHSFGEFDDRAVKHNWPWYSALTNKHMVKQIWTKEPLIIARDEKGNLHWSHKQEEYDTCPEENVVIKSQRIIMQDQIDIMKTTYHEHTLAYVIAEAIKRGFKRMILYGVEAWEYQGKGEYGWQIPCINTWLKTAENLGMEILIPWNIMLKVHAQLKRSEAIKRR
jgi:hypothetical protein